MSKASQTVGHVWLGQQMSAARNGLLDLAKIGPIEHAEGAETRFSKSSQSLAATRMAASDRRLWSQGNFPHF